VHYDLDDHNAMISDRKLPHVAFEQYKTGAQTKIKLIF
jgi:hypothetical protein